MIDKRLLDSEIKHIPVDHTIKIGMCINSKYNAGKDHKDIICSYKASYILNTGDILKFPDTDYKMLVVDADFYLLRCKTYDLSVDAHIPADLFNRNWIKVTNAEQL